jgi:hypothetical protein
VQLKQKSMKKFILIPILILLVPISVYSQTQTQTDSLRLEIIDETLREYGKQQSVANKITIVTIGVIGVGTLIGVPALPLLIVNTVGDLTMIIVTSRSNKKLSKHKSKDEQLLP